MGSFIDLTGKVFNRLTVEKRGPNTISNNTTQWWCKCTCGVTKLIRSDSLTKGLTLSCGCYMLEKVTKHGAAYSRTYMSWRKMLGRCFNEKHHAYSYYLGRGITLEDDRWLDFNNFINDMGDRPSHTSLDRIDNDRGYSKNNCRWASSIQQARNRSTTVNITYKDQTKTLSEWACEMGLTSHVLSYRLKVGWKLEKALLTPSNRIKTHA